MIVNILKIPNLNSINYKENRLDLVRFKYIHTNKLFYKINYLFYRQLKLLPKQVIELIINKKYILKH